MDIFVRLCRKAFGNTAKTKMEDKFTEEFIESLAERIAKKMRELDAKEVDARNKATLESIERSEQKRQEAIEEKKAKLEAAKKDELVEEERFYQMEKNRLERLEERKRLAKELMPKTSQMYQGTTFQSGLNPLAMLERRHEERIKEINAKYAFVPF